METLETLTARVMNLAKEKGFGVNPTEINVAEKIALIHSELSEALDAYRKKRMNGKHGFPEELADTAIRLFQLAAIFEVDLEKEILSKLEVAKERTWDWDALNNTHS
jgi:NTP pyrophosphatase (non-canonical NTP hydrolase)